MFSIYFLPLSSLFLSHGLTFFFVTISLCYLWLSITLILLLLSFSDPYCPFFFYVFSLPLWLYLFTNLTTTVGSDYYYLSRYLSAYLYSSVWKYVSAPALYSYKILSESEVCPNCLSCISKGIMHLLMTYSVWIIYRSAVMSVNCMVSVLFIYGTVLWTRFLFLVFLLTLPHCFNNFSTWNKAFLLLLYSKSGSKQYAVLR